MFGNISFDGADYFEENNLNSTRKEKMPINEAAFTALQNELADLKTKLDERQSTSSSENAPTTVHAVAEIKLSPFIETDPELWFAITESHFTSRQITSDKTKYHHLVAHLPSSVAQRLKDIIMAQYENGQYDKLKKEIITIYAESATAKFEKLISNEPLGDMKPSQALHKIKSLAAGAMQDDFVKKLWLKRLPQTTRTVLAASSDSLENLAKMADSMWEVSEHSNISSISQVSSVEKTLQSLQQQIERLSKHVFSSDRKTRRDTTPHQQRNSTRSKSNKSAHEKESDDGVCWYHRKYKEEASKCRSPCSFAKN